MSENIRIDVASSVGMDAKGYGVPGQVDRLERLAERAEVILKTLMQRLSPCLVPQTTDGATEGCPSDTSNRKESVRSDCELADWLSAKSDRLEMTLDSLKELHDRIDL